MSELQGDDGGRSPFPPYSYVSGRFPHPISDPAGHSFGHEPPEIENEHDAAAAAVFEQGIRLFNAGYYWESHEAWEAIWKVTADVPLRRRLQALIKLAAAAVKGREGRLLGVEKHLTRAAELMRVEMPTSPAWMKLDWDTLLEATQTLQGTPNRLVTKSDAPVVRTMPFQLCNKVTA